MNHNWFGRLDRCITHALRTADWCSARDLQARRRRRISSPTPPAFREPPLPWPPPGRAIGRERVVVRASRTDEKQHTPSEGALCVRGLSGPKRWLIFEPLAEDGKQKKTVSQSMISAENGGEKGNIGGSSSSSSSRISIVI